MRVGGAPMASPSRAGARWCALVRDPNRRGDNGAARSEPPKSTTYVRCSLPRVGNLRVAACGVAFAFFCKASIVIRRGIFGIEPDRLVVVGDGAVVIALGVVRDAPVDVRLRQFGIEPDRLVVVG